MIFVENAFANIWKIASLKIMTHNTRRNAGFADIISVSIYIQCKWNIIADISNICFVDFVELYLNIFLRNHKILKWSNQSGNTAA